MGSEVPTSSPLPPSGNLGAIGSVAKALAGGVRFGDIEYETAESVLLAGLPSDTRVFRGSDRNQRAAARERIAEGHPAFMLFDDARIPRSSRARVAFRCKPGAFWMPALLRADVVLNAGSTHPKGERTAWRFGKGIRHKKHVAIHVAVALEIDGTPLEDQARLIDQLEAEFGLRPALVVMSGDVREASIAPLRFQCPDVEFAPGKSLHVYYVVRAVECGDPRWQAAMDALCALLGADSKATDAARLLRKPGVAVDDVGSDRTNRWRQNAVVRVQTCLRADRESPPWDLDELVARAEHACARRGLDVGVARLERKLIGELARAADDQAQQTERTRSGRCPGPSLARQQAIEDACREVRRLAAECDPEGMKRVGRAALASSKSRGRYRRQSLDPNVEVTVEMPNGERQSLPLQEWGRWLLRHEGRDRGSIATSFVRCWAPTKSGLCHTSGDAEGRPRESPAATLALRGGAPVIYCHVDRVAYRAGRELDPGAGLDRPLPAHGESKYLSGFALPERSVLLLRSDTGTGKTTAIAAALGNRNALVVVPRVAIADALAPKFGAAHYREVLATSRRHDWSAKGRLVVCVNSLLRFLPRIGDGPFWLVIDESEQVVSALFGDTMSRRPRTPKGKPYCGAVLEALLQAARTAYGSGGGVIVADAHAGDRTLELVRLLSSEAPNSQWREVGISRRRRAPVVSWADRDKMLEAVVAKVREERRVAIAAMTLRRAREYKQALDRQVLPSGRSARVRLYTSPMQAECGLAPANENADLANVNSLWAREKCDVVIYTTVASAALSYDGVADEAFDLAVLDWGSPYLPYGEWTLGAQMLDRVRHPGEVWFQAPAYRNGPGLVPSRSLIIERLSMARAAERQIVGLDGHERGGCLPGRDHLAHLLAADEHARAHRRSEPRADLEAYFRSRGAQVESRPIDVRGQEGSGEPFQLGQYLAEVATGREQWFKLVGMSLPLASMAELRAARREVELLARGPDRDRVLAQLCAHELAEFFGRDVVDAELARRAASGILERQVVEFCRAALFVGGHLRPAVADVHANLAAGSLAAVTGDVPKTKAAILLLEVAFGPAFLQQIAASLLALANDAKLPTSLSTYGLSTFAATTRAEKTGPLDQSHPRRAGATRVGDEPRRASRSEAKTPYSWSSDDGALLVDEKRTSVADIIRTYGLALERASIDAGLLTKVGFAPIALTERGICKAIGRALEWFGLRTKASRPAQRQGPRRRWYRLDMDATELHVRRSVAQLRRMLEQPGHAPEASGDEPEARVAADAAPTPAIITSSEPRAWNVGIRRLERRARAPYVGTACRSSGAPSRRHKRVLPPNTAWLSAIAARQAVP